MSRSRDAFLSIPGNDPWDEPPTGERTMDATTPTAKPESDSDRRHREWLVGHYGAAKAAEILAAQAANYAKEDARLAAGGTPVPEREIY